VILIRPRELFKSEIREIHRLAVLMCANYDNHYKECLLLNDACYMTYGVAYNCNGLCKYFRNAILPLNPKLEYIFAGKHQPDEKQCIICGNPFIVNGRQAYCSQKCKSAGNRIKSRERMKNMRKRDNAMLRNSHLKEP